MHKFILLYLIKQFQYQDEILIKDQFIYLQYKKNNKKKINPTKENNCNKKNNKNNRNNKNKKNNTIKINRVK